MQFFSHEKILCSQLLHPYVVQRTLILSDFVNSERKIELRKIFVDVSEKSDSTVNILGATHLTDRMHRQLSNTDVYRSHTGVRCKNWA